MSNAEVLAAIRAVLTREHVIALQLDRAAGGGIKIACEIVLGVKPGCESAIEQARDVVAAAIACGYGGGK